MADPGSLLKKDAPENELEEAGEARRLVGVRLRGGSSEGTFKLSRAS
jgi:hypothetical protein